MKAEIYSTPICNFCKLAKNLLESKGIEFTEYQVGKDIDKDKLEEKVGNTVRTVPQIFVDDKYIGGYQELERWMAFNRPDDSF